MKLDNTTLNSQLLQALDACQSGIDFVKHNKLETFPIARINEITGDFLGYVEWAADNAPSVLINDEHGNLLSLQHQFGTYSFDEYGNAVHAELSNGSSWTKTFNHDGYVTSLTHSDPFMESWIKTYDSLNNNTTQQYLTSLTHSDPFMESWIKTYDSLNNNTTQQYLNSQHIINRTFDSHGNVLTNTTDKGTTHFTYNENNQILTCNRTSDDVEDDIGWVRNYTDNGKLTIHSDSGKFWYTIVDDHNNLLHFENSAGKTDSYQYTYHHTGQLKSVIQHNNTIVEIPLI